MTTRSADEYADFVLPYIGPNHCVLDVGCGPGSITIGLAATAAHVTGVDVEDGFDEARGYAERRGITNVSFQQGTIFHLEFDDAQFDVATCLSMLETLDDPVEGLVEVKRTLKPGGVIAVSSVEYGGLLLQGPDEALVRRFYELRLKLWAAEDVHPFRGRDLRGLLFEAGFDGVDATMRYFDFGTDDEVRSFGRHRAEDCRDAWYVDGLTRRGLATFDEIHELEQAWLRWSEAPDAFAAFSWGRAIGRKPLG